MTNLKKMCMAMIVMAVGLCVLAKQGQQGGCAGVREKLLLIKQQMGGGVSRLLPNERRGARARTVE